MKAFLLITTVLIASYKTGFCQCPTPGLKIQSAACEDPRNLEISSVSCLELKIKWLGSKGQSYVLRASYIDPVTNQPVEIKNTQNASDKNTDFSAAIKVKEGANVSWSIQAVCSIENATVYSAEVKGTDANIPFCQQIKNVTSDKAINIYPNPASGYLKVEYKRKIEGSIEFRVLDVTGKKVLNKVDGAVTKSAKVYTLDLRNLPPGTYMLEAADGNNTSQAKFVLLRN